MRHSRCHTAHVRSSPTTVCASSVDNRAHPRPAACTRRRATSTMPSARSMPQMSLSGKASASHISSCPALAANMPMYCVAGTVRLLLPTQAASHRYGPKHGRSISSLPKSLTGRTRPPAACFAHAVLSSSHRPEPHAGTRMRPGGSRCCASAAIARRIHGSNFGASSLRGRAGLYELHAESACWFRQGSESYPS